MGQNQVGSTMLSPCLEVAPARTAHWCPTQANEPLMSVPLTAFPFALAENVTQLIPEPGSLLHSRVLQYRELLDSLPMDAYTHGCILHPELTTDSMIPKYATAEIRSKWPLHGSAQGSPRPSFRLGLAPQHGWPPCSCSSALSTNEGRDRAGKQQSRASLGAAGTL